MFIIFWFVLLLFVIASFAVVAVVLLQDPKEGGLGEGLGGASSAVDDLAIGSGGMAGGLERLTVWVGGIWMLLAIALAIIPRA